ncbi:IS701 family transposase [Streptomyces sp. HB2AG]|uniref:IS701 family transposase n=1 Tax=Streptomyces sp. HB2AG TaxID=2983400 RepID=UPI0022AAC51B|nr:transposase [Streptomyces sp. HB2AG]MCZ2526338.1 transposase [Streptomyces sp. HB2AG]
MDRQEDSFRPSPHHRLGLEQLLSSLPRSDQRRIAEAYVRGLLHAEGRKTLQNIARHAGGSGAQNIHHFISGSSWQWAPVRETLARRAQQLLPQGAWVIKDIVIPKSGQQSVGVDRHFLPRLGRTVTGQRAFGAWLVSQDAAVPVNWSLFLSRKWLGDPDLRRRANIPEGLRATRPEEAACHVAVSTVRGQGLRPRPVVVDVEGFDASLCAWKLARAGVPVVVRIPPDTPLTVDTSVLGGYSPAPTPACQLVSSMRWFRHKPDGHRIVRIGFGGTAVTTVPVLMPSPGTGAAPAGPEALPMLLVAEWGAHGTATRLWLVDSRRVPWTCMPGLVALPTVVDRDGAAVSERVGIRDFAGRSFDGWHRHVTLASAAHLLVTLHGQEPQPDACPAAPVRGCA